MAEDKKSFLFYCNWINTFEAITEEQAGRLILHILRYVNDQNPESPDDLTNILFQQFKYILKQDLDKYEAKRLKNSENAKKRWHATASNGTNRNAKHADKDNVNDKGNGKDTVKGKVKDKKNTTVGDGKPSLHSELKNIFMDFYLKRSRESYYWEAKDAAALKKLIGKIRFKLKEKDMPEENKNFAASLRHILNLLDDWTLNHLSMTIINSKFNEIINTAKNGKSKTGVSKNDLAEAFERRYGKQ